MQDVRKVFSLNGVENILIFIRSYRHRLNENIILVPYPSEGRAIDIN